jgi:hypothetical protein
VCCNQVWFTVALTVREVRLCLDGGLSQLDLEPDRTFVLYEAGHVGLRPC